MLQYWNDIEINKIETLIKADSFLKFPAFRRIAIFTIIPLSWSSLVIKNNTFSIQLRDTKYGLLSQTNPNWISIKFNPPIEFNWVWQSNEIEIIITAYWHVQTGWWCWKSKTSFSSHKLLVGNRCNMFLGHKAWSLLLKSNLFTGHIFIKHSTFSIFTQQFQGRIHDTR